MRSERNKSYFFRNIKFSYLFNLFLGKFRAWMRDANALSSSFISILRVFFSCSKSKVTDVIYTLRIVAIMKDIHSFWNFSSVHNPSVFAGMSTSSIDPKNSVSIAVNSSLPRPAIIFVFFFKIFKESFVRVFDFIVTLGFIRPDFHLRGVSFKWDSSMTYYKIYCDMSNVLRGRKIEDTYGRYCLHDGAGKRHQFVSNDPIEIWKIVGRLTYSPSQGELCVA